MQYNTVTLGFIVLAVVVVALLAAWMYVQRRRRAALRERFGPEYDRVVRSSGAPAKADAILEARARRVAEFDITPLSPADRTRVTDDWRRVQARFVDDPQHAVVDAESLIAEVMRLRGYPVEEDLERRAADLSVYHANVVDHYRSGRAVMLEHKRGAASTEDLRQAMVHFRALFDQLVTGDTQDHAHARRAS